MAAGRKLFVTAVVLAGGSSERFGAGLAKQFLDLAGRPMLAHTLGALERTPEVTATVVVLPAQRPPFVDLSLTGLVKVASVTNGGPTRQASLGEGLICLPDETEIVLVHDAARPAVQPSLVARVVGALGDGGSPGIPYDGAVPAIPVDDALKEVTSDGLVVGRRSRAGLWRAQTPQGFRRECIEDALARADAAGILCEDCAEMAVRAGYRVRVVPGDPINLKATRREDLRLLEALLAGSAGG
ncbi:MAG TPA: 2-C-methyl-D-erythritol 4-phosphate cytidylyltransferase [Actinomycetota bacterium]|jgi:2-C-methyl-D-erythritol 4-phosphate cytidylyltransferase